MCYKLSVEAAETTEKAKKVTLVLFEWLQSVRGGFSFNILRDECLKNWFAVQALNRRVTR